MIEHEGIMCRTVKDGDMRHALRVQVRNELIPICTYSLNYRVKSDLVHVQVAIERRLKGLRITHNMPPIMFTPPVTEQLAPL